MREKIILVCTECLSRNYTTSKKKAVSTQRMQLSKFCARCNKKTIHKESKQEGSSNGIFKMVMAWY